MTHDGLARIASALVSHDVEFVVVGAWAAQAQGVDLPVPTLDIDFMPEFSPANLERLSAALDSLDARVRAAGVDEGLAFDHRGDSLARVRTWNLTCEFGEFDVAFEPDGLNDYGQVAGRALTAGLVVGDRRVDVPVAHLLDIIRSKEAAGRAKDLRVLPVLRSAASRLLRFEGS